MDVEERARELYNAVGDYPLLDGETSEGLDLLAAALTEAHAAGAEPYAREALLVLSKAGIPTPERGYVADGGAGLMGGDLRRLWAAGRLAGRSEVRELVAQAAERHPDARLVCLEIDRAVGNLAESPPPDPREAAYQKMEG